MNKYYYEFERVNAYCYPESYILVNKFGIKDGKILEAAEREFTSAKMTAIEKEPVKGKLGFKHLCAIHRYLFCDIYHWAGETRTINIAKGNQFVNYQYLDNYANDIFSKLKGEKFLAKTKPEDIPARFAYYFSEINVLHPFREGNGRTQRVFICYLAQSAGYYVDFSDVSADKMIEASALAFALEYDMMTKIFERITTPITLEEQKEFRIKLGLTRLTPDSF